MHTARRADIICVSIGISFLQHVPVPNTGYIMHTARWAENNTKKIICKMLYNARFVPVSHAEYNRAKP